MEVSLNANMCDNNIYIIVWADLRRREMPQFKFNFNLRTSLLAFILIVINGKESPILQCSCFIHSLWLLNTSIDLEGNNKVVIISKYTPNKRKSRTFWYSFIRAECRIALHVLFAISNISKCMPIQTPYSLSCHNKSCKRLIIMAPIMAQEKFSFFSLIWAFYGSCVEKW